MSARLSVALAAITLAACTTASGWVDSHPFVGADFATLHAAGLESMRPPSTASVRGMAPAATPGPDAAQAQKPAVVSPPTAGDRGEPQPASRDQATASAPLGPNAEGPAPELAALPGSASGWTPSQEASGRPEERTETGPEPSSQSLAQAPIQPGHAADGAASDAATTSRQEPSRPTAQATQPDRPAGQPQPDAPRGGTRDGTPRVSVVSDALPLRRVLASLASSAGLALDLPDRSHDLEPVSVELIDVPLATAAQIIVAQFGWEAEVEVDRLKIVTERFERVDLAFPDVQRSLTSKIGGDMTGSLFQSAQGASGTQGTTTSTAAGGSSEKSLSSEVKVTYEVNGRDIWAEFKASAESLLGQNGTVTVQRDTGAIWLRGLPRAVRRAADELKRLDRDLSTPVYLQLSILDVTLDSRHRFGIDWQKVFTLGHNFATLTVTNPARLIGQGLTTSGAFAVTLQGANGVDAAIIRALDEQGRTRVLSQPRLSVANGQTAILSVGDIVPFVAGVQQSVAGTSGTVLTTPIISQAQSGITIAITPRVSGGEVMLHLSPVVNDITSFKTFSVGGSTFENPVIATKSMSTVTRVASGQTVLLGGLIDRRSKDSEDEIPWLGRIPVLGHLFRNTDTAKSVRELVLIVTPVVGHGPGVTPGAGPS